MQRNYARPWADNQADARSLVVARGGEWHGTYGLMSCPHCQPERRRDQRALSVTDRPGGGLLATCHKSGCSFIELIAGLGLAGDRPAPAPSPRPARPAPDDEDRTRRAMALWAEAGPLAGSLAAKYLALRGLDVDPDAVAHCLRFHPACPIRGERLPCMIALMADALTGQPCGIQRTALTPDARKHDLGRAMLGRAGACMVSPDEAVTDGLILAEGVEDALALIRAGLEPVWATMNAGAMSRFPILPAIEAITLVCDGDAAGRAAALECAARWQAEGREAEVLTAPDGGDPAALLGAAR